MVIITSSIAITMYIVSKGLFTAEIALAIFFIDIGTLVGTTKAIGAW